MAWWSRHDDKFAGKVFLSVLILLGVSLFMCNNCNFVNEGVRGSTTSISESKELGVFVAQYLLDNNPIILSDAVQINVEEAWAENMWFQSRSLLQKVGTVWRDRFYIYIKVSQAQFDSTEHILGEIDHDWRIKVEGGNYLERSWNKEPSQYLRSHSDSLLATLELTLVLHGSSLARKYSPRDYETRRVARLIRAQ